MSKFKQATTPDQLEDGAGIYNICQKYLTDAVHYKRHFKDILD